MPKKYDLEERTAKFAESVIELCNKTRKTTVSIPVIDQLVRAATSVGANYVETNGASSKKDFKNKISICRKEIMETKYWLRMLVKANEDDRESCRKLWQEAQEITLIFSKIFRSTT